MIDEKAKLRRAFARKRNSIDVNNRTAFSKEISDKLIKSEFYKSAEVVFTYVSVKSEIETLGLIKQMLEEKKTVAVPRCNIESHTMDAVAVNSLDELIIGAYGIPEPKGTAVILDKDAIDLCIVPGLAFDFDGMRLGYGGGYYDRFLQRFNGSAVGVAFDECLVRQLPRHELDVAVDAIITPQNFICIKERKNGKRIFAEQTKA